MLNKWVIAIALLYGGYYYASRHYDVSDAVTYAKKNPGWKYAQPVEYYAGLAYYQRGQYDKSQEAFSQLLTDHPTTHYAPTALLRLSEVATENRDYETARQALGRFLEEFPDHKKKNVAEQRLELIKFK